MQRPQVGEVWRFHGFPGTPEEHQPYWIEGTVLEVYCDGTPGGEVRLAVTEMSDYTKRHGGTLLGSSTHVSLRRRHEPMGPVVQWVYAEEEEVLS